jgi:hypothetical protein
MDLMSVGEILKDFRSIKLSSEKRKFVDDARVQFERDGDIPFGLKKKLWAMVRHYSRQFNELHESRARARRTNWKRRTGTTEEQARCLVEERRRKVVAQKEDLGL